MLLKISSLPMVRPETCIIGTLCKAQRGWRAIDEFFSATSCMGATTLEDTWEFSLA